ncbi:hypothetical protein BN11_1330005 [Nostocoides australiense Ben110]|uniref:Uncharacterized protein n=1 Tax=Nostocoides australiense Ben110 TaxID=1193182 RepID=W6JTG9_9MICO|nr:hypothetical protein BN11_1330005 [Tetrasphaera australiensis Ben110]
MDHLGDAGVLARAQQRRRPSDIDRLEEATVTRKRYLCDIVEDDIDPRHCFADKRCIRDISPDELDVRGPVVGIVEIENSHAVPALMQGTHENRPEVSTASGH